MLPVMVVGAGFDSMKLILLGKDSRKFVEAMGKVTSDTEIVGMECFPLGVPFYLHRYVTVISEDGSEFRSNYVLFTLSKGQPWPDTVVPLRDQDRVLTNRTHPLYVLVRGGALPTLKKIADEHGVGVFQLPDDFWGAIIPAAGKPKN
jgi:hypothetical protein